MKKFFNVLGIIILGLVTAIIIGGFVWYGDINLKNVIQDSAIKVNGEKCINIESMAKSNDNSIDEIKINMATKQDIKDIHIKLEKGFERLENIVIWQGNKNLISDDI